MVLIPRCAYAARALSFAGKDFDAHVLHGGRFFFDRHAILEGQRLAHTLFRAHPAYMKIKIKAEDPEIVNAKFVE